MKQRITLCLGNSTILAGNGDEVIVWNFGEKLIQGYNPEIDETRILCSNLENSASIAWGCVLDGSLYYIDSQSGFINIIRNIDEEEPDNPELIDGTGMAVGLASAPNGVIFAKKGKNTTPVPIDFYMIDSDMNITQISKWDGANYYSGSSFRLASSNDFLISCITTGKDIFIYSFN